MTLQKMKRVKIKELLIIPLNNIHKNIRHPLYRDIFTF